MESQPQEIVKSRSRKANWAQSEVDALRSSYLELRGIIDGRLGASLCNSDKERAWHTVKERVNAQSCVERKMEEVKKKLSDIKSTLKKRERERRLLSQQTGGGPAPSLLSIADEKMLEAIGEVAVGGFGGIDTFTVGHQSSTIEGTVTDQLPIATGSKRKAEGHQSSTIEGTVTDQLPIATGSKRKAEVTVDQLVSQELEQYETSTNRRTKKKPEDEEVLHLLKELVSTQKQMVEEQKITNQLLQKLILVPDFDM